MRAATSVWDRPSSRRSVDSSPHTDRRRSAISRKPGKTVSDDGARSSHVPSGHRCISYVMISYL